ncbi:MAG: hypothetical protein WC107_05680 [Patescibacteria group bacterium]|jgi:hypothetical protein
MNISSDTGDDTRLPTINTYSDLAKIRFIADSSDGSFRGSNKQKNDEIKFIRSTFAEYLYDSNPPKEIIDKLLPIANKLLSATDRKSLWVVSFYEPV